MVVTDCLHLSIVARILLCGRTQLTGMLPTTNNTLAKACRRASVYFWNSLNPEFLHCSCMPSVFHIGYENLPAEAHAESLKLDTCHRVRCYQAGQQFHVNLGKIALEENKHSTTWCEP